MMIHSKRKMTPLIGLLAIVLGFVLFTPKMVQADDDNALAKIAPWGLNDGINQLFSSWQNGKENSGWSAANYGGTNAYVYQSGGSATPAYLWSKSASLNLMQDHKMSYWILLGTGNNSSTDNVNDGMAFVINGSNVANASTLHNSATSGTSIGVWGDPDAVMGDPWSTAMKNSLAVEFDPYQNRNNYDSNSGTSTNYNIGAGYPGDSSYYPTNSIGDYTKKNLNLEGNIVV